MMMDKDRSRQRRRRRHVRYVAIVALMMLVAILAACGDPAAEARDLERKGD